MVRLAAFLVLAVLASGCSTPKFSITASTLQVNGDSAGRQVASSIPLESLMERFDMTDRDGRQISYIAFTDTDYGGLLFVDDRLYGTLSKRDAHAFYSCRGHVSVTNGYWARDALDWADLLLGTATPATSVSLNFSGKPAVQSVKEVASNPMLSDAKSLINMGTNPLSIFNTLNSTRSNYMERERYKNTLQALNSLAPGDEEQKLATIAKPEDISFTNGGMVMAYPGYLQDFYVSEGVVRVRQQPSFLRLSHQSAAIFYVPGLLWEQCNPRNWLRALPVDWSPPAPQ